MGCQLFYWNDIWQGFLLGNGVDGDQILPFDDVMKKNLGLDFEVFAHFCLIGLFCPCLQLVVMMMMMIRMQTEEDEEDKRLDIIIHCPLPAGHNPGL